MEVSLGPVQAPERQGTPPEPGRVVVLGRPDVAVSVRVWWPALMSIIEHAGEDPDLEVMGLLLGRIDCGEGTVRTWVWDVARSKHVRASVIDVTMTHEAWGEAMQQVWARADGAGVVGWYHTHPGMGVFMSAADTFIAEKFFCNPGQISMVYDNKRQQLGAYWVHRGKLEWIRGIELALAHQARDVRWQRMKYGASQSTLRKILARLTGGLLGACVSVR